LELFNDQLENEEGYKDLLESAHDLIHMVHPDGTLAYVNRSWSAVLGYSLDEIQGRSIYSFIAPADRDWFRDFRQSVIAGQLATSPIVVTFITNDGQERKLEGMVTAKFKDGTAIYTRGIFRDITQRLINEGRLRDFYEEVKKREESLLRLLERAPDAIVVADHQSRISFWNSKAVSMFGWESAEVVGKSLSETIIPPQYREAHEQGMKRYLATGEAKVLDRTIEITALDKSGNEFFVSLTISTTEQKGQPAFIAFIRDISEQKKAQAELEKKTRELEVSNRQLERFAHVASHDMKEPIRKIRVFNEMVRSRFGGILPDTAKMYLQKIEQASDRLFQMVEGVLNFSSMRNTTGNFEQVRLENIVESIKMDLELLLEQKKAEIIAHEVPPFEGVPFLIYQLFYNLINNSLKFTRPGITPRIEISGYLPRKIDLPKHLARSGPDYLLLQVADNGIGFEPEHAEKIFQTFTRLHAKDKFEGTGLGLALCRNIVERHHGTITAEGKPGEGAVFNILLPLQQTGE